MNENKIQYIEEDEIDLRELWKTLMKRKGFIVVFTAIVTIGAIIWALTRTPIYEAKAVIKIGEYKVSSSSSSSSSSLDSASSLVAELKVLYIDLLKNQKDRITTIENISVLKGQKDFIEMSAQSIDNNLASQEIKNVLKYIQDKHNKILIDVKNERELQIKNLNKKIDIANSREIPLLLRKIDLVKKDIKSYENNIKILAKNISGAKNKTPALAMLEINEQRHITDILFELKQNLLGHEENKFIIETVTLEAYQENIDRIKVMLEPYNYKNTQIIGKIMTNDYPIKPKKKLIVVVAFVTGFILSIFLVFFLEFIGKNEDEIEKKEC